MDTPLGRRNRRNVSPSGLLIAILTGALAAAATTGDVPRRGTSSSVTFKLGDRVVRGDVLRWDDAGAEGTFGRVEWRDLAIEEAWHLHVSIIDQSNANDWLAVGRALARHEAGRAHAERALRWAAWLATSTLESAESDLANLAALPPAERPVDRRRPHVHRRDEGPFEPWPVEPPGADEAETATLEREVDAMLKDLGLTMGLYAHPDVLFYSDLPESTARSLLVGVRATDAQLRQWFAIPKDGDHFRGKLVMIVCREHESMNRIAGAIFGRGDHPKEQAGFFQSAGARSYLIMWRFPDALKLGATIAHEYAHAFLHRYRSPAPLPLWLDEGFADFVASRMLQDSPVDRERRPVGEWFVRRGGPVDDVFSIECMHEGWPGPRLANYGISYLAVRGLMDAAPNETLRFIRAVKEGIPWEKALQQELGLTRAQLVERVKAQADGAP